MGNKKKNLAAILAIAICSVMVVVGIGIKYIFAAPGSQSGLGTPGQALYNTTILYDSLPSIYVLGNAFRPTADSPLILGPYIGTIASINDIAGMTGTVATAHLYYGYNWCKKYPDDLDCNAGRMPLCLIIWAPTANNADKTYQSCYSQNTSDPMHPKAWRAALNSDTANDGGYSQIWQLQVLLQQPGITGLDAISTTL